MESKEELQTARKDKEKEQIDISLWNDLEMSMLLVDLIKKGKTTDFLSEVRKITKAYKAQTGKEAPKIDLIFVSDDLTGETDGALVRNLRFLKALRDNFSINKYFEKIIVKSKDPDFPSTEPNVFSSNISFEKLK